MSYSYQASESGWAILKEGHVIGQLSQIGQQQAEQVVSALNGTSGRGFILGQPIEDVSLDVCEDCGSGGRHWECCDRILCEECHNDPGVDDDERSYGPRRDPCPAVASAEGVLMPTVEKIIQAHSGMSWLKEGNTIRLENPPFMRLVIEYIGDGPRGLPAVSVAHYYEQNGDAMRDPEIVFEITDQGWEEAVSEGSVRHPKLVAELKSFARMWDRNIAAQGFLERCPKGPGQARPSDDSDA